MARARNIKPGLFKNEVLVEQSLFVRMLFIGLWTLADREGRLEDRPKRIKLELFPYDSDDVDSALNTLAENGFIERYESDGKKVVQITNFLKHQTPHGTEKDSDLPEKDGSYTVNERNANGYVTGKKRSNNVNQYKNNVNAQGSNSEELVCERPDSLIPDSLNNKTPISPCGDSVGDVATPEKKKRTRSSKTTLSEWFESIREKGEKAISDYKPVWDYAHTAGLPDEFIEIAWLRFKAKYSASKKTYIDWRAAFRDHVEGNYLGLWFWSEKDNQFRLTTAGVQADRSIGVSA